MGLKIITLTKLYSRGIFYIYFILGFSPFKDVVVLKELFNIYLILGFSPFKIDSAHSSFDTRGGGSHGLPPLLSNIIAPPNFKS